jgi:hypothetical protein
MRKLVLHMREARTEGDMLLHMQAWIPCTASMIAGPYGPVRPRKLVLYCACGGCVPNRTYTYTS